MKRLQTGNAPEAPGAGDLDRLQRSLERLLRLNASRRVHAKQAAAAGLAISQPGYLLLRRIQEHGPVSLGDLARMTEMDPAAAGRFASSRVTAWSPARPARATDASVW